MANNCSVRKFKGDFDNDELLKIGEMKIYFKAGAAASISFDSEDYIDYTISGDTWSGGGTSVNHKGSITLTSASTNGCVISISDKYQLTKLKLEAGTIDKIVGINYTGIKNTRTNSVWIDPAVDIDIDTLPTSLYLNNGVNCHGSLNNHAASTIFVVGSSPNLTGKFSSMSGMRRITIQNAKGTTFTTSDFTSSIGGNFNNLVLDNSGFSGNIQNLATLTAMGFLSAINTNVNGTLESLANGLVSNGKSSGQLKTSLMGTGCTFDGDPILRNLWIYFGSSIPSPTQEETAQGWGVRTS